MSIFKFGKFNIVRVVGSDLPYEGDTGMVINFRGNLFDGIEYYVQLKNAGLSDWFTGDKLVRERDELHYATEARQGNQRTVSARRLRRASGEGGSVSKFWVSWWTKYLISDGCTQPPFQTWESGMKPDEEGDYTISSMCALVEAKDEAEIWKVIKRHFPDYEERMCEPVSDDWKPNDRFPDFENRVSLYK